MQEIESMMMVNMSKFRRLNEQKLEKIMEKYDLRKIDMEIILYLHNYKDVRTAKDIAATEMFTKGHISQSVKRLREREYIIATQDMSDLRVQNLQLTDKAIPVITEVDGIKSDMEAYVFSGVTEEEIAVMKTVFAKMCDNINKLLK
ncbi:MAG: MarR family winged helix-turn-helix transcriptional regulator [Lachnospiraceae bacterium]|nr:MarR family winged helix-turn-helix transcriptional regulator [Lachnospiraceae bacterium]